MLKFKFKKSPEGGTELEFHCDLSTLIGGTTFIEFIRQYLNI